MSILSSFFKKDSEELRKKRAEKKERIAKRNESRKIYRKKKVERRKLRHSKTRKASANNLIIKDE